MHPVAHLWAGPHDIPLLWKPVNMDVHTQLPLLLKQMGDTADAVADLIMAEGIQGVRHTVRFLNPLVRYLHQHLLVDDLRLDVMKGDRVTMTADGRRVDAAMPAAVRQFLENFNNGGYPACELPLDAH